MAMEGTVFISFALALRILWEMENRWGGDDFESIVNPGQDVRKFLERGDIGSVPHEMLEFCSTDHSYFNLSCLSICAKVAYTSMCFIYPLELPLRFYWSFL